MLRQGGWLRPANGTGQLEVEILWDGTIVCIATESEEWHWLPREVEMLRLDADEFRITLAGEHQVLFRPRSPMHFENEMLPRIRAARADGDVASTHPGDTAPPTTTRDDRWTGIVTGRNHADLMAAIAPKPAKAAGTEPSPEPPATQGGEHDHDWTMGSPREVSICRTCLDVFVDLSDAAARHQPR